MSEKGQGDEGVVTGLGVSTALPATDIPVRVDRGMALDASGDDLAVEVKSDFILDAGGQSVDADARGVASSPASEGTAGGRPMEDNSRGVDEPGKPAA